MIRNLILDFGDIFINLDKQATQREMANFGFTTLTPVLDELCKAYEKGTVSSTEFIEGMTQQFPKATGENLVDAWNAILLDFPEYRLEFLEQLVKGEKYRIFLLSNTNEIHIDHVKQTMGVEKYNRFKNAFEHFYLSYEMGMRKPDAEIFEHLLQQHRLKPEETLFVDDTKENTDTAAALGIQVWNLMVGKEDIVHLKTRFQ